MDPTVKCSCGRTMTALRTEGVARFRCGCGASIQIEGLPGSSPQGCPVIRGRRACTGVRRSNELTCRTCAEVIANNALLTEEIFARLSTKPVFATLAARSAARVDTEAQRRAAETEVRQEQLRRRREARRVHVVYYALIRPGVVKIGTTQDLKARMRALRLWNDDSVLAVEPGTQSLEALRHREFAELRAAGTGREDFELDDRLQSHIRMIRESFGDPWKLVSDTLNSQLTELAKTQGGM